MFWKKRHNKCPLEIEDVEWVNENLLWIDQNIIDVLDYPVILPTEEYFDMDYDSSEDAAVKVYHEILGHFKLDRKKEPIQLNFYSEGETMINSHQFLSRKEGAAGWYFQEGNDYQIWIEKKQLYNPESLVATIAHELSHYVLIGKHGVYDEGEENEWLTDLLAITYGFGIFVGNSKFKFEQWSSGDGWGGWSSSSQGYLPQKITAYVMAEIEINRGNYSRPNWLKYLEKGFKYDFVDCFGYLNFIKNDS